MICPNLADPTIRKQFNELKSVLGEPIAYYVWNKNNGHHLEFDSKGNPSQLFNKLLDLTADRKKAIQAISLTFSNKYKDFTPTDKKETLEAAGIVSPEETIVEAEKQVDVVLKEIGESPEVTKPVEDVPAETVADQLATEPEAAVDTVVDSVIEEEVTTEEDRKELEEVHKGKSELIKKIKNLLGTASSKAYNAALRSKSLLGRVLRKVLRKLRLPVLLFAVGTSSLSFSPKNFNFSLNNLINNSTQVLPDDWKQSAIRKFVKLGMYDLSQKEATVEYKESKQKAPVKDTVTEFTEIIGTVQDEFSSNKKDSLVMLRNQFDNSKGFTYRAGPMKSRTPQGYVMPNSVGVAHFLILDDQGVDLSEFTSDQELKAASNLFKKRIGQDIKPTDFIPTFTRNENGVTLKYKKASEVTDEDIVLTKMINYNFGQIDFKSNKSAVPFGFKNNIRAIANEDGEALPSFLFSAQGKNKYSRFSGASVVFIFQDKFGNTVVRDFTGSLEMIEKEGESIAKQYGVNKKNITLGVYDAGSYTGKPKANVKGELKTSQYVGYNTLHKNSAGALIIPRSIPSPNKGLMLIPLLALMSRARRNNQPLYQEDIDRVLAEREKLKQISREYTELDKLLDFIQDNELKDLDKAVNQYFGLAAKKTFPKAQKAETELQRKAIRAEVKQQREFRKEMQLDPKAEAKALLWFKTHPISRVTPLKNLSRVINQYGFASWTKHAITLHKGSVYSDLYHEAWHEFTQMYLTQAERDVLYEEVKKKIGEYNGIPFSELTNKEIEEYLAEGFRNFAYEASLEKKEERQPRNFIEKLYDKIWKFINWLVGKDGKVKPESKDILKEAYQQLYSGTYVNNYGRVGTPEFQKLYAGAIVGDYTFKESAEWGEQIETQLTNGELNTFFLSEETPQIEDGVYKLTNGTNVRIISTPVKGGKEYTAEVVKDYQLTTETSREVFKAFDYFFFEALRNIKVKTEAGERQASLADLISDTNRVIKKEIYDYIQTNMAVLYEEKKDHYNKIKDTDDGLNSIERDQFLTMFLIMNDFEALSNMHFAQLKDVLSEIKDDVYEIEGESRNKEDWAVELGDIDPIDNADPLIYTMLKGLPDLTSSYVDDKKMVNRGQITGLPQTGDFNRNWNILIDTLSGTSDYNTMIARLTELAENFPQFSYLLNQLPKSVESATTLEDLKVVAALVQSIGFEFSPWGLTVRQKTLPDGKPGFEVNLHELATTAANKVKDFLDTDFMHNPNRPFRVIFKGEYVLDLPAIEEKFYPLFRRVLLGAPAKPGDLTTLDFYKEVFGMDFTPFTDKPKFKKIKAKLNAVFLDVYKRIYVLEKEKLDKGVRRPFGLLTKNYSESTIKDLRDKYKEDVWLNSKIIEGSIEVKVGTINNFKKDLEKIFTYYDGFYKLFGDKAFLNQEKNLQYAIVPYNEIFYVLEQINNAKSVDDVAGNLQSASVVTSTFSKYSNWISRLFNEDGTKKETAGGDLLTIKAINWAGPQVTKANSTSGKGKKSSNLKSTEKFVYDYFSFIRGNVFENIRFGEKNTSMALVFSATKQEAIPFAEETFMTTEGYLSKDFESQMLSYLAYELEMYFKSPNKRDRRFIIFSDFLSPELKEELLNTIEPLYNQVDERGRTSFQKGSPARKALFLETKGGLRDKVVTSLENYFRDEVRRELRGLGFAIIPNASSFSTEELIKRTKQKISEIFETPLTPDSVERTLLYYISNYFVHQVELTHLLIANPRNYQKTEKNNFREAFKRFGLTSSPGRQARTSSTWIDTYNKFKSRDLEKLTVENTKAPGREDLGLYNDKIRMSVSNDVYTNQNNKESVLAYYKIQIVKEREALGKKKLTESELEAEVEKRYTDYTEQKKEADAQAWGNLDFIRFYLESIRRWTPPMEAAYQFEKQILTKLLAYKNEKNTKKKLALWNELQALRYEATYGQIPSLKLGLYGSALGFPDSKTAGKFSVHTLLPSVVIGTDLEDVMINMFTSRTDLHTFQSGSKLGFPAETFDLYNKEKDRMTINPVGESNIATFSIEALREQQYIAPKFKEESTLGTQFTKLIFGDFYDAGEFSSDFSADVKILIENAQKEFTDNINTLVALEKENLAYESGVILVDGKVVDVNKEVFYNWLKKQGEKRDTTEDFINFANDAYEYSLGLDSIGFRNFVESILTSAVNKRLIRPKISGEPYIQTASTGYGLKNNRYTNATTEQLEEYGINGLRDYRIEDGVTQPADCKIAFNPNKHSGLLALDWNGEQIGNVNRLNQALQDNEWVKEHSDKLIIIGVRIPTQNFNSMEYFRVREFLPTAAGAVMIVPPSIVTKSGSDFDIDKLFMYEPNIGEDGNLINSPIISKAEHQRNLDFYKSQINEINAQIEVLSAELLSLPEYKVKEELKQKLKDLAIPTPQVDIKLVPSKKKVTLEELQEQYKQQIQGTQTAYTDQLKLILKQIAQVKKDSSRLPELYTQIAELKTLKDKWYEARQISENEVKDGINTIYNGIIFTAKKVLSHPALFEVLTKPNNNNILVPTIKKFYDRLGQSMDSPISGTKMYFPSASTLVHKDTLESKKSLGIVAKMNALHKLYQQSGLKWGSSFYNMYYLDDVAVDRKVSLGVKYSKKLDENGMRVLVSDLLSQFVNGHVDIGKEDWINRIRSDEQRAPLYMQMVIQGTSLDTSIMFLMQPAVNEYFARVSSNIFQDILYPGQAKKTEKELFEIMLKEVVNAVNPKLLGKSVDETIRNILSPTQEFVKILKGLNFEDSFKSYPISTNFTDEKKLSKAVKDKNVPYLKTQLAVLAQLYVLLEQNNALVKLNQNIDFNTMNFSTLQEMYENQQFLIKGEINEESIYEVFEPIGLTNLIENSVVSPFNVSGFGVDLYSRFYEVTGNPKYLAALRNHYIEQEKDQYGFDFLSKYVNKFNNDFVLSVFQNAVFPDGALLEFYPKSLFEENGLPAMLESFKKNNSPEMKKLFETNNFLKYLRFREIEGTQYFYPALAVGNSSKESKDDFTAQFLALTNAKFKDLELEEEFGNFINYLALGTLIQKGFISKLNTIQPFTSYKFFSHVLNQALVGFQNILTSDAKFNAYFNNFAEKFIEMNKDNYNSVPHFKDFSDNLRISTTPGELIEAPEPVTTTVVGPGPDTKINIYFSTGENAELSNFANRPFKYAGFSYSNVEQAFQHLKFVTFGTPFGVRGANLKINPEETMSIKNNIINQIEKILNAKTGAEAKRLGGDKTIIPKKYNKELLDSWDANSSRIMKKVLKASFEQNPEALAKLLATGNATLTHTQDKTKWKTEFPRLLMEVREELRPLQPAVSNVEITKVNYTRQEVQNNPNTAYVFTENTYSITAFPNKQGGGSAIIRPEPNAFAIVTKKKYDYNTKENVDYTDTPEDFKEFIEVNTRLINELKNSGKSKIVFPQGFATDKAKMPTRFAEWLQKELLDNFGLVTEFNSTKTGLISKSVRTITPTVTTQEKESPVCPTAPPI